MPCTRIDGNPDVSGIGIRVNFYATILLIAAIPQTPQTSSLLGALYTNAGLSGLGLLLTAIIQTGQQQLSLYHAIVVQHILFFLGVGVNASGKYKWNSARIALSLVVTFLTLSGYCIWAVYMWASADHFGPQWECNNGIKYVFFFATVRATVPWLHKLWMAALIISTVLLLLGALVTAGARVWLSSWWKNDEESPEESPGESESAQSPSGQYSSVRSFPLFLSAIYATIMLELMVHRNKHIVDESQEQQWTFGQVLALVMIVTSLNEVVHFLFAIGFRSRKGRAEPEGAGLDKPVGQEWASNTPPSPTQNVAYWGRDTPVRTGAASHHIRLENLGSSGHKLHTEH
ncbi:hypothetical protein BV25DRAFT_1819666 [Artomyces pyxidatus]|uniref:Uncharacterized protein n=1 Tax=Artomyces pyxidatus TaxID=48021 RepID=A0ACB8TFZ9_9AGAM|nr:hypothetical protein BV25DRAFT_1819666 [Artomyces pyxidatus]